MSNNLSISVHVNDKFIKFVSTDGKKIDEEFAREYEKYDVNKTEKYLLILTIM